MKVPISKILLLKGDDGNVINPRGEIHDTTDLQLAMGLLGQIEDIKVRESEEHEGYYELISGHRRLTAAKAIGWEEISISLDNGSDTFAKMVAANVRKDIAPTKLGAALRKLITENNWGITKSAQAAGLKPDKAQLYIDLLEAPESLQKRVDKGEISVSAWKALRNQSKETQVAAAKLENPTVARVKKLKKEIQENKGQGISELLENIEESDNIVAKLNILSNGIKATYHTLNISDKMRITAIVEDLNTYITQVSTPEELEYA